MVRRGSCGAIVVVIIAVALVGLVLFLSQQGVISGLVPAVSLLLIGSAITAFVTGRRRR